MEVFPYFALAFLKDGQISYKGLDMAVRVRKAFCNYCSKYPDLSKVFDDVDDRLAQSKVDSSALVFINNINSEKIIIESSDSIVGIGTPDDITNPGNTTLAVVISYLEI